MWPLLAVALYIKVKIICTTVFINGKNEISLYKTVIFYIDVLKGRFDFILIFLFQNKAFHKVSKDVLPPSYCNITRLW